MGCDIHMWAEVLIERHNGPAWDAVGKVFPYAYRREGEPSTVSFYKGSNGEPDEVWENNQLVSEHPTTRRNYCLFAILADVRNGVGFAGVDTGDRLNPIVPPRGIPDDASAFYQNECEKWGRDGHSHSWLTIGELRSFDWDQTSTQRGWVDQENYQTFKESGRPKEWAGGVWGRLISHVNHGEMDMLLANPSLNGGKPAYTQVEWQQPYREVVGDFLTTTLPALEAIAAMEKVNDLRIVFFFDN